MPVLLVPSIGSRGGRTFNVSVFSCAFARLSDQTGSTLKHLGAGLLSSEDVGADDLKCPDVVIWIWDGFSGADEAFVIELHQKQRWFGA